MLDRLSARAGAAATLLAGLAVTVALSIAQARVNQATLQQRFESTATSLFAQVGRAGFTIARGLRGIRGYFQGTGPDGFTQRSYLDLLASRDIGAEFLGLDAVGFWRRVSAGDLAAFVVRARQDQGSGYQPHPERPDLDEHYLLQVTSDPVRYRSALGLDSLADPRRAAALRDATGTGLPQATAPFSGQEPPFNSPGRLRVVVYLPVFASGPPPPPAARAQAVVGMLSGVVAIEDLVAPALRSWPGLSLSVVDVTDPAVPSVVYEPGYETLADEFVPFQRVDRILSRHWRLQARPTQAWVERQNLPPVALVAVSGLLASCLLAVMAWLALAHRGRSAVEAEVRSKDAELLRAREELQRALDAVPTMIAYYDKHGVNRLSNAAHSRWFGREPSVSRGLHARELLGADFYDKVGPTLQAALQGVPHRGPRILHDSAGAEHEFYAVFVPDPDPAPSPQDAAPAWRGAYVVATDVTELARSREQLAAALRDNEALLSTLHTYALVSVADPQGRITDANEAFCALSGYSRDELLGQDHRIVNSGLHPHAFWRDMWRSVGRGRAWRAEVCNRSKAGALYWVDSVIAPFLDENGRVQRYISIRTDITAAKAAQQRVAAAQADADRANRAKTAFLANMSHEIRTPLNAIVGLNYLLGQHGLAAEDRELVARMSVACEALLGIITNVLDVSKIEAGELQLENAAFRPDAVLARVTDMMTATARTRHLNLRVVQSPSSACAVVGDATRFGQIVTNLVGNAIKFTPDDGCIDVGLAADADGPGRTRLTLEVRDTGIGMSSEVQQAVFEPFVQADESITRRFGGTGLGLSIVRQLVELMGGRIGLDSHEGEGSRFTITLSLPDASLHSLQPARAGAAALQVLVVDSDTARASAVAALAAELGWQAQIVASCSALAAALAERDRQGLASDALVVDCSEPGSDAVFGAAGADQSKPPDAAPDQDPGHHRSPRPPAVRLVTQAALAASLSTAAGARPANYLVRPFDRSGLFNAVAEALSADPRQRDRLAPLNAQDASAVAWLPGLRVLVTDDSGLNLDVARRILEREGATVTCCASGAEAIDVLRRDPAAADAVLMDLQMPLMDGVETTRLIRAEPGLHALPIIALTAGALTSERERALGAGMNEFLSKPLVPHLLVRALREQIGAAQGRALPIRSRTASAAAMAVAGWPEVPGIDANDVAQRLHGDHALFVDMLHRLIREFADLSVFDVAVRSEELASQQARSVLVSRAHKLAGSAAIVAAGDVERLAAQAERSLRDGAAAAVNLALLQQLAAALQELARAARKLPARKSIAHDCAPEHAARARAGGAGQTLDPDSFDRTVELGALLERQDLEAVARFHQLAPQLAAAMDEAGFEALRHAVTDFEFARAAGLLGAVTLR